MANHMLNSLYKQNQLNPKPLNSMTLASNSEYIINLLKEMMLKMQMTSGLLILNQ